MARTEVIVVDDGSDDGTAEVAGSALGHLRRAEVVRVAHRGKGAAVREGVRRARGDAIVFTDADMASDPRDLSRLVAGLDAADVAIGSRAIEGSSTSHAPFSRVVMGRAFNRLVRAATGLSWRDTQCGFKAFRASAGKRLFELSTIDGFAFDVEILTLADRLGYRVVEVPVQWTGVGGSHVRPLVDSARMVAGVARSARHARHLPAPALAPAPEGALVAPVLPPSRA